MADTIRVLLTGADETASRFAATSNELRARLRVAIDKLGAEFIDYLRANKLSGTPLHRRSGALQASFHYTVQAGNTGNAATAVIGSDSPYAAYHEYGFHGSEQVRGYTREGHQVRPYTRKINYAGRPYLHPALDEYHDRAVAAMQTVVDEVVK